MESQNNQKLKQTISKDSIFKVRRVHKFNPDKCSHIPDLDHRPNFQAKGQKNSQQQFHTPKINCQTVKKSADYHYQISIVSSEAYKELNRKYQKLKQKSTQQKHMMEKEIIDKQEQLQKYRIQRIRLNSQYQKLLQKKNQILRKINFLRQKREQSQTRQNNVLNEIQSTVINMQQLRDMMLSIRYQNGLDIDPDNMTYEELLQLGQKIGHVSKGFTLQQIARLPIYDYEQKEENQVCSICYCDLKNCQKINKLDCKHLFHVDCIKDWLLKEKICPMCKQDIKIHQNQEGQAITTTTTKEQQIDQKEIEDRKQSV